jgi:hypothetical protein
MLDSGSIHTLRMLFSAEDATLMFKLAPFNAFGDMQSAKSQKNAGTFIPLSKRTIRGILTKNCTQNYFKISCRVSNTLLIQPLTLRP